MPKLERDVVNDIRDRLRKEFGERVFVFKNHGSAAARSGLPDLVASIDGYFIGIEVKRPDKPAEVTPLQRRTLDQIRASGSPAIVATSPVEVMYALTLYGINP